MKDRIKQLMDAQHMNQQTFASCTGISGATLSSIFTGRTRPTLNIVDAITDKFPNVNPMWLLKGKGGMFMTADDMAAATTVPAQGMFSGQPDGATGAVSGDLFSSANMAVEPTLFGAQNKPSAAISAPSQNTRPTPSGFQIEASRTPLRKITEIRVFYDDQTWESFTPKK